MEPPDEDAEGDDRPKEAQREAAYRRDQDRGEQRRLARRLLVERPRKAIVGRVGRARLVVVIGDIIAPVRPRADADHRHPLPLAHRETAALDRHLLLVLIVIFHEEAQRSEEHTSELQSLMRISYAVSCLKKKTTNNAYI